MAVAVINKLALTAYGLDHIGTFLKINKDIETYENTAYCYYFHSSLWFVSNRALAVGSVYAVTTAMPVNVIKD